MTPLGLLVPGDGWRLGLLGRRLRPVYTRVQFLPIVPVLRVLGVCPGMLPHTASVANTLNMRLVCPAPAERAETVPLTKDQPRRLRVPVYPIMDVMLRPQEVEALRRLPLQRHRTI